MVKSEVNTDKSEKKNRGLSKNENSLHEKCGPDDLIQERKSTEKISQQKREQAAVIAAVPATIESAVGRRWYQSLIRWEECDGTVPRHTHFTSA
jgi:hypothetical protein